MLPKIKKQRKPRTIHVANVVSNKAVAYLRVSTKMQDCSLELQEEKVRAYCGLRGFELVEILKELDVSGKTRLYERQEGCKITSLISSGVSHIIAWKLDRIFRNAADALTVSEEWLKQGVSLHIVEMSGSAIDTGSPQGRMFFTMLAGFAEFERATIAGRITTALQQKKKNGLVYCPKTPYGYTAVGGKGKAGGDGGRLVENREEAATIALMQGMREQGRGYRSIAKELNKLGIKSKLGGEWHPFTVSRILAA